MQDRLSTFEIPAPSRAETLTRLIRPNNSSGAFPDRFRVTHRNYIRVFSRALQQTSQHAAGPQLNKEIASKIDKSLHAIKPAHCTRDFIFDRAPNFISRFHLLPLTVTDYDKARCRY